MIIAEDISRGRYWWWGWPKYFAVASSLPIDTKHFRWCFRKMMWCNIQNISFSFISMFRWWWFQLRFRLRGVVWWNEILIRRDELMMMPTFSSSDWCKHFIRWVTFCHFLDAEAVAVRIDWLIFSNDYWLFSSKCVNIFCDFRKMCRW